MGYNVLFALLALLALISFAFAAPSNYSSVCSPWNNCADCTSTSVRLLYYFAELTSRSRILTSIFRRFAKLDKIASSAAGALLTETAIFAHLTALLGFLGIRRNYALLLVRFPKQRERSLNRRLFPHLPILTILSHSTRYP